MTFKSNIALSMVVVYFIRHGVSCANIHHADGPTFDTLPPNKYIDPPLTDIGIKKSIKAGVTVRPKLPKVPVFCSPMLRACETARVMFPKSLVTVIPYCKEAPHEASHQLMNNVNAKRKALEAMGGFNVAHLAHKGVKESNFDKCIGYLEALGIKHCIVVCHSVFMYKNLNMSKFPLNNCVVKFDSNSKRSSVVYKGVKLGKIVMKDVQRCKKM